MIHKCCQCSYFSNRRQNLIRHFKNKHSLRSKSSKISKGHSAVKSCFKCDNCNYESEFKSNIKRHILKLHSELTTRKSAIICPVCKSAFGTRKVLNKHFTDYHHVVIEEEEFLFDTENEFIVWKKYIEDTFNCKYILTRGIKKLDGNFEERRLYCHRDGNFKESVKSHSRQIKSRGSNKMNASCPSHLVIRSNQGGKFHVVFIKTHFGHECDAANSDLPSNQEVEIVGEISRNMPAVRVLDDVRVNIDLKNLVKPRAGVQLYNDELLKKNTTTLLALDDQNIICNELRQVEEASNEFSVNNNNDIEELRSLPSTTVKSNNKSLLRRKFQTIICYLESNDDQFSKEETEKLHKIADNLLIQMVKRKLEAAPKISSSETSNKIIVPRKKFTLIKSRVEKNQNSPSNQVSKPLTSEAL